MVVLNDGTLEVKVSESRVVLVKVGANWCGPCRAMTPIISDLADKYEGEIEVGAIDIDTCPDIAHKYSISAIPVLLFFKDGVLAERLNGAQTKAKIEFTIKKLVDG